MQGTATASQPPPPAASPIDLCGCLGCGQLQTVVRGGADLIACATCGTTLERAKWRGLEPATAFAAATFLLLLPAVTLPLMRTSLLGASREATLLGCVNAIWHDGRIEVAAMVFLTALALPIVRFALLSAVLGTIVAGRRPAWLGRAFRVAEALQPWAMPEIFLVGFVIAFLRLRAALDVEVATGGLCVAAAGLLALLTRATMDPAAIWRAILPEPAAPHAPVADAFACASCARVAPGSAVGGDCPRCCALLRRREPYALVRSLALIIAAALLYLPANLYPLATLPIGAKSVQYTVLEGVIDLAQAKLLGLALIVLTASFVIPIVKLGAMAWCITSILNRSRDHLRQKTRAYYFVEEIGRWSMVDAFVIASFAPVATYNSLIYGRADEGASFFVAVVVLTMIAVRRFDPRQIWDAAAARG